MGTTDTTSKTQVEVPRQFNDSSSITFTVYGQPVGYVRTTQRGAKFDPQFRRYCEYKDHIQDSLRLSTDARLPFPKPLNSSKDQRVKVSVKMYFPDNRHPDPDNVFKSVLDALFKVDKYVYGDFSFDYDKSTPRIEVKVSYQP